MQGTETSVSGRLPNKARFILDSMWTKRFHTVPTINTETVAAHHGLVCALIAVIWPDAPAQIYRYAALHDAAEFATGDIPSPVKRAMSESGVDVNAVLKQLEIDAFSSCGVVEPHLVESERKVFKLFDNLAGLISCYHEMRMGNRLAAQPARNFSRYIDMTLLLQQPFHREYTAVYSEVSNGVYDLETQWGMT